MGKRYIAVLFLTLFWFSNATNAVEYPPYEEIYTSKAKSAYPEDINVWVYTSEFAKRFGMPDKWIDDSLKGADAVAYRVEVEPFRMMRTGSHPTDGMPWRSCMMDVFVKSDNPLPWADDQRSGFVPFKPFAAGYLEPQYMEDKPYYPVEVRMRGLSIHNQGYNRPLNYFSSRSGRGAGNFSVMYFIRDIFPGLDNLTLLVGCMQPPEKDAYLAFYKDPGNRKIDRNKYHHRIDLPDAYMKRVYENWYEKSRKATIEQFERLKHNLKNTPSRVPPLSDKPIKK